MTLSALTAVRPVDFYALYPYAKPSDIIQFVDDVAQEGDTTAVIKALDAFHDRYPMYNLSPRKAALLKSQTALAVSAAVPCGDSDNDCSPRLLELGSFFGYSAIHTAQAMGPRALLTMVEANEENADVAKHMLVRAFGRDAEVCARHLVHLCISRPSTSLFLLTLSWVLSFFFIFLFA
jgi:hypothetical protein